MSCVFLLVCSFMVHGGSYGFRVFLDCPLLGGRGGSVAATRLAASRLT